MFWQNVKSFFNWLGNKIVTRFRWCGMKLGIINPTADESKSKDPTPILPKPLQNLILEYAAGDLGCEEQKVAEYSSTHYCRLFEGGTKKQPYDKVTLAAFLQYVAHGDQDRAEEILKKAQTEDPAFLLRLLTTKATVVDNAGRIFKNITAFQYTLWAKDRHMWQMLLKYLPERNALEQYQNHKTKGVTYELEGRPINEKHYDFSPLITALQRYVAYMRNTNATAEAERIWCKEVGKAQRYVPAHVAQEYLREDRSFDQTPTFKEPHLPRTLRFYNWLTKKLDTWFSDLSLGSSFAIYRAGGTAARSWGGAQRDLAAVTALGEVRTREYTELPNYFNVQPSQARAPEEEDKAVSTQRLSL